MMKYSMIWIKKLSFAPLFLLILALLIFLLKPLFSSTDLIFSLSMSSLIQFILISTLILIVSFLFSLFATLSQDWRLLIPTGLVASIFPLVFFNPGLGLVLSVGIFVSILLTFLTLEGRLKSYLTFEPSSILGPSIRHLSTFLVIIISVTYFFSINQSIQENGFEIPDSLIETALKLTPQSQSELAELDREVKPTPPPLTAEQIELLKQNPQLLQQYGIDPNLLDSLNQQPSDEKESPNTTQQLLKQTLKDQFQKMIDPYLGLIPLFLAGLFFLTLLSITSFLNLLIYPLLWIIFYILEKTRYIRFEIEQRPVKKMVI
ncbi:hypothetical protein HYS94_05020 [Candidatus Daviesbacteria bacterium]|nr:hypothetical protein [Candidatus Daviesbacteria bacterium]